VDEALHLAEVVRPVAAEVLDELLRDEDRLEVGVDGRTALVGGGRALLRDVLGEIARLLQAEAVDRGRRQALSDLLAGRLRPGVVPSSHRRRT